MDKKSHTNRELPSLVHTSVNPYKKQSHREIEGNKLKQLQRSWRSMEVVQEKDGVSLSHEPLAVSEQPVLVSQNSVLEFEAAATKVQKVYKSYRTRRNLADSAVIAEELWWKALDSIALTRSSISFFDNDKHKTAISKWARAKTRVAKFGKGLSQNVRAQKLALPHWLEAIDPRHRYGESLKFYYDFWLESQSTQPFFYWLDVGEGKEVDLEECPRSQLQSHCVRYLGSKEREDYEVIVEDSKLVYKKSRELVHTDKESKWIFVLSTTRTLYVGKKVTGSFHHSSFLSGATNIVAGGLQVDGGVITTLWPHSGHYRTTTENFKEFICFLEEHDIDLANVTKYRFDKRLSSFVVCDGYDDDEEGLTIEASET